MTEKSKLVGTRENEAVLQKAGEDRVLISTIRKKQSNWYGADDKKIRL